ncbi:DMT family transporter [Pelagibius sp. Alg239-R121]|uniref:DMT family transporter n=1 Tax=Pelagibius sp. Alg239-R121 TaxID=2993448 RepID=UPI0024A645F3|nr:DMT family transporter [Pelagibius sp. Alg239-R121]
MSAGSGASAPISTAVPAPVRPLFGWLAALTVVFVWSGWVVVSRFGVVQTLTIYDMLILRFAVAAVAVSPFVWRFWPRRLRWWQIALVACGQGVPYLLLAFGGFKFAPASHAGIMMNGTLPVFAAILGWVWLKDRPDRWRVAGMTVILAGCVLIGWDRGTGGVASDVWIGHLMFLAATLFVAFFMIATKAWQLTPMQTMVCIPTLNLLWFAPFYLLFLPKGIAAAPWSEILLQGAYQGLGPSVIAVLCFTTAVRSIGTSSTAAMMAMVPGMAALLAIPLLGEWPSFFAWTGLVLATGGILLAAGWRPGRGRAANAAQEIS